MTGSPAHFKGKSALSHVVEAQARGIIAASEIHGTEIPGSLSSAFDAARDLSVLASILVLFGRFSNLPTKSLVLGLIVFFLGLLIWKVGRSAWLAWSRLERLHKVLEEEHWEIEHHRAQEREELKMLYQAKGFEGDLLEQVLDVLMADNDRLLKVMIEEELGLSLEVHEHPLMQGLGAGVGVFLSSLIILIGNYLWPWGGVFLASIAIVAVSSYLAAYYQSNRSIPAVVWNLAITLLSVGSVYFFIEFLKSQA